MHGSAIFVFVLVACGGSPPATRPLPEPAGSAITPPVAQSTSSCDDPEHLKGAQNTYDCAVAALSRNEIEVAAKLALSIKERFPYSKIAVLSEELYGDILFASEQYADAAEAYGLFIKFHPTNERVPDVQKKLTDAQARAKPAPN